MSSGPVGSCTFSLLSGSLCSGRAEASSLAAPRCPACSSGPRQGSCRQRAGTELGRTGPRLQQLRRRTGSSSIRGSLLPECRAKAPPWVAGGRAASGAAPTRPGCAAAAAAGRALLGPLRPWCVLLHSNRARALRVLEVAGLTNRPFPRSLSVFCPGIPGLELTFQKERDAMTALPRFQGAPEFIDGAQVPPRPLCGRRTIPAPSS